MFAVVSIRSIIWSVVQHINQNLQVKLNHIIKLNKYLGVGCDILNGDIFQQKYMNK